MAENKYRNSSQFVFIKIIVLYTIAQLPETALTITNLIVIFSSYIVLLKKPKLNWVDHTQLIGTINLLSFVKKVVSLPQV